MRLTYSLLRGALFFLWIVVIDRPLTGCTKSPGLNYLKADSTDTTRILVHHDSAKFYMDFAMMMVNTSGVFLDSFADDASMIVYVVDGVVNVPNDSIRNFESWVLHRSGSSGAWSATWVPDDIGESNVVGATGFVNDTTVVMTNDQSGTLTPKWSESYMGGTPFYTGGDPTPGWPLAFSFSTQQQSQYPLNLRDQLGDLLEIWVYKDY